jgi:protein-L-isoaspartate(D-aspartate) O-methyltransferase
MPLGEGRGFIKLPGKLYIYQIPRYGLAMTNKQRLMAQWQAAGINPRILDAFDSIPREQFVMPGLKKDAYNDTPLPTVRKQSISQPSTVMLMLQALDIQEGDKIFELGSGVGYQASLMSVLVGEKGKVVTTEIIPELIMLALSNITALGLKNVHVMETDGSAGYQQEALYDKAIITAACPDIPKPIIDQVKVGGTIIAPVGDLQQQTMIKATKKEHGLDLEFLGSFVFVPMKGKFGFGEEAEVYY